jgi:DAK2 domain fusion protein YloV
MSSDFIVNPVPPSSKQLRKYPVDGQVLKELTEAALAWLSTNQQTVNALNVFPVPDGDTGTNMVLTMQAAFKEIGNSSEKNAGKMAHAIAHGALMGARGNSGVILSQLWRGFARALDSQETIDGPSLARALATGRDTAYKGVVRPVEGTILTVAKDIAAAAEQFLAEGTTDPYDMLTMILPAADKSVQHTPELLPVLKDAGVVDSGGKGLFYIFEGMVRYLNGQPLDTSPTLIRPLAEINLENVADSIEPGQDFEIVVDFRPRDVLDLEYFYTCLEEMGTSIQVGEGDGLYRMHIHVPTEKLYEPIDFTRSLGDVTKVAIENLLVQLEDLEIEKHEKTNLVTVEPDQIAVVAVSPGSGISRVFASLGVAAIVEGGQTMNPSTQEILRAFENLPTDKIIILPNNKNIILAAKAAAEMTVKKVIVIPTRSIPQGMAAMMRLAPEGDLQEVAREMTQALDEVETGEITIATRSVEIDDVTVQEGQIIALHNGKLVLAAVSLEEACLQLLHKAHADHFELITFFFGANLPRQEVNRIVDLVRAEFPDQEIEVQEGDQPHYQFIIAIE